MTEEPRWPTVRDVEGEASTPERFKAVTRAIDMCRAAWLASVDDPVRSPIGEMRETPSGGVIIKFFDDDGIDLRGGSWVAVGTRLTTFANHHPRGWPVIGAVPGTPAAEAKP